MADKDREGEADPSGGACRAGRVAVARQVHAPDEVIVIAPVRVPVAVGVNVTVTVQVAFCARVAVQLFVWVKSPVAAETAILPTPPLFAVSVTLCDALVVFVTWFV